MAEMMARKGVKIAGWQDIATDYNDSYSARVAPQVDYVNLWVDRNFRKGVKHGSMALRSGFTPLICDFGHFYLDFAHSTHPEEEGLNWGGVIDEFKTLDGYAGNVAPRSDADKTRILGVQGQLCAPTHRWNAISFRVCSLWPSADGTPIPPLPTVASTPSWAIASFRALRAAATASICVNPA